MTYEWACSVSTFLCSLSDLSCNPLPLHVLIEEEANGTVFRVMAGVICRLSVAHGDHACYGFCLLKDHLFPSKNKPPSCSLHTQGLCTSCSVCGSWLFSVYCGVLYALVATGQLQIWMNFVRNSTFCCHKMDSYINFGNQYWKVGGLGLTLTHIWRNLYLLYPKSFSTIALKDSW